MVHGFPCIFKCPAFVFKRKGTEPFVFVLLKIKNPKIRRAGDRAFFAHPPDPPELVTRTAIRFLPDLSRAASSLQLAGNYLYTLLFITLQTTNLLNQACFLCTFGKTQGQNNSTFWPLTINQANIFTNFPAPTETGISKTLSLGEKFLSLAKKNL